VADSYANQYGPYEWKQQVQGFDLLDLRPWIDRIRHTANDIEYAQTLVDYVASLNDAHDIVNFPLNFGGDLGFTVDIYDGACWLTPSTALVCPSRFIRSDRR